MIIIGYQGIGKSTICRKDFSYLDLESSSTWIEEDGVIKRLEKWYKQYATTAVWLNEQGYTVFTSSHKEVVDEIVRISNINDMAIVIPSLKIKDKWIEKLRDRYFLTKTDKDEKAYFNALKMYDESIKNMKVFAKKNNVALFVIEDMSYDLQEILYDLSNHKYNSDGGKI